MLAVSPETLTDRLVGVVDELAAQAVDHLSTAALGDDLALLRRQIDRLEAQFIRRLTRFDAQNGAQAEKSTSTVAWVRSTCGLTGAAAADRVRMARVLEDLPQTQASFQDGRAPFTNVAMIARLAESVGPERVRTVEPLLATAAERLDPARMYDLTVATRLQVDAEGGLAAENRIYERRWLSCARAIGGGFVLSGELDTEGGALVTTALDVLSKPSGPEDERNGGQRRADALVELARRQLQSGNLPEVHGQRPHLVLTTTAAGLKGATGAAAIATSESASGETAEKATRESATAEPAAAGAPTTGSESHPAAEVCGAGSDQPVAEVRGAGPVPSATAQRIACDAAVSTVLVDGDGAVVAASSESRTIPAALRTALAVRDKGCVAPGCGRPPAWTDAHHVIHRANHGKTELANLVLLCRRHHRMVHEGGWDIRRRPDGMIELIPAQRGRPAVPRL